MTEPTGEELALLIDSITGLAGDVKALHDETAEQSAALDRARIAIIAAAVITAIALVVGLYGVWESARANDRIAHAEQQRLERTLASCQQTNDFYAKHNALVDNDQETFRIIIRESVNPAAQRFAQDRLDAFETNKIRTRDCTPRGIERYLSTTTTTR